MYSVVVRNNLSGAERVIASIDKQNNFVNIQLDAAAMFPQKPLLYKLKEYITPLLVTLLFFRRRHEDQNRQ